jgi:beta-glucosidase
MDLASFNPETSSWIADAGQYTVRIGSSSKDIMQKASFSLGKAMNVKTESVALVPKEKIGEIKP